MEEGGAVGAVEDAQWLEQLESLPVADLPPVESAAVGDDIDGIILELIGLPPEPLSPGHPLSAGPSDEAVDHSYDSGSDGGSSSDGGGGSTSCIVCPVCPLCHEENSRISRFWRKLGYAGPAYCWKCAQVFKSHMLKCSVQSDICCREAPCARCVQIFAHFATKRSEVFAAVDRATGGGYVSAPAHCVTRLGTPSCAITGAVWAIRGRRTAQAARIDFGTT
jgi:hypothetical protein